MENIMTTKIIRCTCKHPFQDSLYGIGNRLFNEMKSGQFKCTVCGTISGSQNVTTHISPKAKEPEAPKVISKKMSADKKDEKSIIKKSLKGGKR
jgi:hypothetical protein